jgi:hypothetical protein
MQALPFGVQHPIGHWQTLEQHCALVVHCWPDIAHPVQVPLLHVPEQQSFASAHERPVALQARQTSR